MANTRNSNKQVEVVMERRCVTSKGMYNPGDKVKLPESEVERLGHCVRRVK